MKVIVKEGEVGTVDGKRRIACVRNGTVGKAKMAVSSDEIITAELRGCFVDVFAEPRKDVKK